MVQSLSDEETEDCAIGVTNENRIQVVYNIKTPLKEPLDTYDWQDCRRNAVYLGRTCISEPLLRIFTWKAATV